MNKYDLINQSLTEEFSKLLVEVYKKTNRYASAIKLVKDVLGQLQDGSERMYEFMVILSWLYYEDNNPEMARAVVSWLVQLDSDNASTRFLQARMSLDQGRTLLAIAELRNLASEYRDNAEYDYYMGIAHIFHVGNQPFS